MGYTAEKVIEIARSQIGYKEKETNSQLDNFDANAGDNNYTKYARDLAAAGYYNGNKNGYAWCDCFHDWCHYEAAGHDKKLAEWTTCQTGLYGAGCKFSADYYKKQGRFYTDPQPGDQIFFNKFAHTGIVEKVADGKVYTIEGNTGNQVKRHTYTLGSSKIDGYGRPKYDEPVKESVKEPVAQTPTYKDYKIGENVEFVGDTHYVSANSKNGVKTVPGFAKVTAIYEKGVHQLHLRAVNKFGKYVSGVHGWVNVSDVKKTESKSITVGSIVYFSGNTHFVSASAKTGKKTKPGKAKVTYISNVKGSTHKYHIRAINDAGKFVSGVYGWVDADDIKLV